MVKRLRKFTQLKDDDIIEAKETFFGDDADEDHVDITSVRIPFNTILEYFGDGTEGDENIIYYSAKQSNMGLAHSRLNSKKLEIYWAIDSWDKLNNGILTLSSSILHEFLHTLANIDDYSEPGTNPYSLKVCQTWGSSPDERDKALRNAANYEYFFNSLPITISLKNYNGYPCKLDSGMLVCQPNKTIEEFMCALNTEDNYSFYCDHITIKNQYLSENGKLGLSKGKFMLTKTFYGGWKLQSLNGFGLESQEDGKIIASNEKSEIRTQFEILFEGVPTLRNFYLLNERANKVKVVLFSNEIGKQAKLFTGYVAFPSGSSVQEVATKFTYYGSEQEGFIRINVEDGKESRWMGIEYGSFFDAIVTKSVPTLFSCLGFADTLRKDQMTKICKLKSNQCIRDEILTDDLRLGDAGVNWRVFDEDNRIDDYIFYSGWTTGSLTSQSEIYKRSGLDYYTKT